MQKRIKLLKNQKGMTLVELLAVLVILGIIAAIAIPMIGNAISESKQKGELNDALSIIAAAKLANANGEGTSFTTEKLKELGYLDSGSTDVTVSLTSTKQWQISGYSFSNTKLTGDQTESAIKAKLKEIEDS